MADILQLDVFKSQATNNVEACRRIYREMKFDPSNVVFSPSFCAKAREEFDRTGDDLPEAC